MKNHKKICLVLLSCLPIMLGWQDDISLNLRAPSAQFANGDGFSFLGGAISEVRLGRYINGGQNHGWRGGALGDVSLFNFGQDLLFHMGLAIETLADDQNEISFRLVQVYYRVDTGIKWRLGPGALKVGYAHRCSHGADNATPSRITIRSGLAASYQARLKIRNLTLDISPGATLYMVGQNSDEDFKPRGHGFIAVQLLWPITEPVSLVLASGLHAEVVGSTKKNLYFIGDPTKNLYLLPIYAARLAMRLENHKIKSDVGLHFAQNLDSGIGPKAKKSNNLSFDVNFLW